MMDASPDPVRLPFRDRADAGRQLAPHLRRFAGRQPVVVLGLPRGGVPVAHEVAVHLGAALDVLVVRKLGVPGHEEFAMGAIASGGVRVLQHDVIAGLGIPASVVEQVTATEARELARREAAFRGGRPPIGVEHAVVILVDDGAATGATMLAAVRALRERRPARLVAAAPVMSPAARVALAAAADACVTLATPEPFRGVGHWYRDFDQTSDAEVVALLAQAAARERPPRGDAGHAVTR